MAATTTRSERADAITVILYAAAALVTVGIATVLRVGSTFRDDGIAWSLPIDEQPISATTDSGQISIEGIAQEAMVFATGVNGVSIAAIVAAIALWALAAVAVIGAVTLVAWNFLRGRFFVAGNARAFDVIGWTLVLAPMAIVMLETMGRNGVTAALGLGDGEPVHPIEFWAIAPIFATGVTVGLIAVAFRRGIRLQQEKVVLEKETEGLV
ncbi:MULTISPECIES: hypothetical protein [Microbacterium]|jgi:hypothetical protein|uniref:DUF2975 domain-containing protein n=1 Tax=Microbacterium paraoxydans TaxID=199592 RepID=A0A1H1R558_9MICO|nr:MULTISPECIES: hypothetical protein [Microbacterium]AVL98236.1 hypothetical protein C6C15_14640 [Microbacterium sp. str. 'China']MCK2032819.1 hypothetical protein [Microbacterium sp. KSW4-4]SDS30934.1 hypothetical protein SAMN04489809_1571 [Microbacterium paraoxydans]